jgi:hypothetical protein
LPSRLLQQLPLRQRPAPLEAKQPRNSPQSLGNLAGDFAARAQHLPVLLSVFVPVAFIPGISGELFRQFAVTVAVSMFLSAINALTLSPALCAVNAKIPPLVRPR